MYEAKASNIWYSKNFKPGIVEKIPLCDLLIEQKEEESTEGKYSSASILMGNYQFVTFWNAKGISWAVEVFIEP